MASSVEELGEGVSVALGSRRYPYEAEDTDAGSSFHFTSKELIMV